MRVLGITASAVEIAQGAFESIATATGTGSSNTITFSSIPSGYQHLQVRFICKNTDTATDASTPVLIRINTDNSANYTWHRLSGNGATASAGGSSAVNTSMTTDRTIALSSATALANMMGVGIIDIHDYASTTRHKTARIFAGMDTNRTTAPTGTVVLASGLYVNGTAAVTSLSFVTGTGNWTTTTQFALYGIKGA